jgi:signal transduction histidine kinase
LIKVKDTGRGIPVTLHEQLFKRFHRINSQTANLDPNQSSGLGLYISKLMAGGMGGDIYLEESVEGVGSTFSFKLPRG